MKSSKKKTHKKQKFRFKFDKKVCFATLIILIIACIPVIYAYKNKDRSVEEILSSADYGYESVYCVERTATASTMNVPADIAHSFRNEYEVAPDMTLAKTCEIYTVTDGDHFMKSYQLDYAPSTFYDALMKGMNLDTGLESATLVYGKALSGEYYLRASDLDDNTPYLLTSVPEDLTLRAGGIDLRFPEQIKGFAIKLLREGSSVENIIIDDVVVGYKVYLALDSSNFGYLAGLFESTKGFPPKDEYDQYEGWLVFDDHGRLVELYLGASKTVESPAEWETAFDGYEICVEYFYDETVSLSLPFDCTGSRDYAQVESYFL